MNIFDKMIKSLKETGEESKTKPIRVELIPKCLMFPQGVNAPVRISSSMRPPEIPEWDAFIRYLSSTACFFLQNTASIPNPCTISFFTATDEATVATWPL